MVKNLSLLMITFIVFMVSDICNDSAESLSLSRLLNPSSLEQLIDLN